VRWRWHPLLFAVYPVLFLYERNSTNLPPSVLVPPLITVITFGFVIWLVSRLVTRDAKRGALLATAVLVLWSAYGHVHALLGETFIGQHRVLLPAWILLIVPLGQMMRRGIPEDARAHILSRTATLIGVALLAWPVLVIFHDLNRSPYSMRMSSHDLPELIEGEPTLAYPDADIYHIVLDGYGRADVLRDLYGHDNTGFLDALQDRGFCIADSARANYTQTLLSLVTMYGGNVRSGRADIDNSYRRWLAWQLSEAVRVGIFDPFCDWTRAFATGYSATEILGVDSYLSPAVDLNEFERGLIATTPLGVLLNVVESRYGDVLHRRRVEFVFDNLAVARDDPPRAFTFAHIVAPHPPFIYAPLLAKAGAVVPLADGDHVIHEGGLGVEQYRIAYRAQIKAVNERILHAIDTVMANGRQSVILLHGDHGPGSLLRWENLAPDPVAARERLGILLAVHLPNPLDDICGYVSTPTGAVQAIKWRLYGLEPERRPERSFFSTWSRPYDFVEIVPDGTVATP